MTPIQTIGSWYSPVLLLFVTFYFSFFAYALSSHIFLHVYFSKNRRNIVTNSLIGKLKNKSDIGVKNEYVSHLLINKIDYYECINLRRTIVQRKRSCSFTLTVVNLRCKIC